MTTFHVPSMTCGGCARAVTGLVHALDTAAKVRVDLASKVLSVEDTTATPAELIAALSGAGYPAVQQEQENPMAAGTQTGRCCTARSQ
jgi:copper chaperone